MQGVFDWVVIGSGFGGSVSALRLAEKGYSVLVVEKGRRFAPADFARSNRDLKRWLWAPELGARGIFQITRLKHMTVLHGVGVGGGSLGYANTLPKPKRGFFEADSWAKLADWERELEPHYEVARRMLGAKPYGGETPGDRVLKQLAQELGSSARCERVDVGVFFDKPGVEVDDPYFGGQGPRRVGCTECGACMTGCRVGAKNTLDKNYLHLAEKRGAQVLSETEVCAVREQAGGEYLVETKSLGDGASRSFRARWVVFAGGVMGTIPLLLAMREDPRGLPRLSERLGHGVRTNSESLTMVLAPESDERFNAGLAITSILHVDDRSHLEPVRYGAGSDLFRMLLAPHAPSASAAGRLLGSALSLVRNRRKWLKALRLRDFAEKTQILLYMCARDETLSLSLGRGRFRGLRRGLVSHLEDRSCAPTANIPEASALARSFAEKVGGVVASPLREALFGAPTTAHVLGGACMGSGPHDGVIDAQHRVFGYRGLFVIDGSAVSANPGVNPSLTITALAERAMSFIPARAALDEAPDLRDAG
jgi:cholesterol oxidase